MPSPPQHTHPTQRRRALILLLLRFASLAMTIAGAIGLAGRLIFASQQGGISKNTLNLYTGIGEFHGLYFGLPLTLAGITLALSSAFLARWIVRPPAQACPRCEQPTDPDTPITTCPECGYTLN